MESLTGLKMQQARKWYFVIYGIFVVRDIIINIRNRVKIQWKPIRWNRKELKNPGYPAPPRTSNHRTKCNIDGFLIWILPSSPPGSGIYQTFFLSQQVPRHSSQDKSFILSTFYCNPPGLRIRRASICFPLSVERINSADFLEKLPLLSLIRILQCRVEMITMKVCHVKSSLAL